jgi:hypothetical protein
MTSLFIILPHETAALPGDRVRIGTAMDVQNIRILLNPALCSMTKKRQHLRAAAWCRLPGSSSGQKL